MQNLFVLSYVIIDQLLVWWMFTNNKLNTNVQWCLFFYCYCVHQNPELANAVISSLKFKLYLLYKDYETSYTTYINHARWHRCLISCERKPTCLDLVTTWPSHMPTPDIEPGSQQWEASALTLRQPDSPWLAHYQSGMSINDHSLFLEQVTTLIAQT